MPNEHDKEHRPIEDESLTARELLEKALDTLIGHPLSAWEKGEAIRLIIKAHTRLNPTPEQQSVGVAIGILDSVIAEIKDPSRTSSRSMLRR